MDAEAHTLIYRRAIAAIGRGDAVALGACLAADLVDHNPIPGQAPGRAGFLEWMAAARAAFPDLRGAVEDVVAEGDRVAGRVRWAGTHRGPFAGAAPTGRRVEFDAIHLVRLGDGAIVEWWGVADLLGLVRQLGALPAPRPPA